ncbi:MAG: hypothetical protein M3N21_04865 [Actinomycetota bacterium]|nr:hypothetical protein [Actinomycetota bacterium]
MLVLVVAASACLSAVTTAASAAGPSVIRAGAAQRMVLRRAPGPGPSPSTRPAPRQPRAHVNRQPLSSWVVHYNGTEPAGARAAFQAAVDTWSMLVASSVPIQVDVNFTDLGPGVLGSAGPVSFYANNDNGGANADTIYPIALINAKKGSDLDPSASDIAADFTNSDPAIYYGTDGNPPSGQVDFETVVLHELGHGLGFLGLMDDVSGIGSWDAADKGKTAQLPGIYDRFTSVSQGTALTPLISLPNNSATLGNALTSDAVYWVGAQGVAANCGVDPRLFAPNPWQDASSYSHLDDTAFPPGDVNALMTSSLGPGQAIHDPGPVALGMFADMGWQTPVTTCSSRYTPLDPVRILDTRTTPAPRVGPGQFVDVQVSGQNGVPPDALSAVINVTGTGPTTGTDIRAYPTPTFGNPLPVVSNLNLQRGETRANLVTVTLGAGGRVRLRNNSGSVALIADLAGYYAPSASSGYHPVTPVRLLNTTSAGTGQRIGPGGVIDLPVAGTSGVNPTASAVALTVTAVAPTTGTDVRAYPTPADESFPNISNLNLPPGPPVPNAAIVKIGANGSIRLRNSSGEVSLIVDLAGWYDPGSGGALFRAVRPQRLLDTRPARIDGGANADLTVVGTAGVPATAQAAVLNVTGVGASAGTDVRVYPVPTDGSVPDVSNLNLDAGQTNADLAIVTLGVGGAVRLHNAAGSIALVADLAGWFGP